MATPSLSDSGRAELRAAVCAYVASQRALPGVDADSVDVCVSVTVAVAIAVDRTVALALALADGIA